MKTSSFCYLWMSLFIATLTMLCPQTICASGATSEEINNAIVLDGSIPLTWENDESYPWFVEQGKLRSGNSGNPNSASSIAFNFTSTSTTTIQLKYDVTGGSSTNRLQVIVDGVVRNDDYLETGRKREYRLPAGSHRVELRDTLYNTTGNYYSNIYDIMVLEDKGASSSEINSNILSAGSIQGLWEQDNVFPWQLVNGKLQSTNHGLRNTSSTISIEFFCENPTIVEFKYDITGGESTNGLTIEIDGQLAASDYHENGKKRSYRLFSGKHVITFTYSILNTNNYYYCRIYDLKILDTGTLEDMLLKPTSKHISFENVGLQPWYGDDDGCKSNNYVESNCNAILRSSFEISERYKLSYWQKSNYNNDDHKMSFSINGKLYYVSSNTDWTYVSVVLDPGSYVLEWKDENKYSGSSYFSRLKEVELINNVVSVNITPGMLGVEALYKVNVLSDIEMLKISGSMNDSDWATIKLMKNLHSLDLTEATISNIPDNAFKGLSYLNAIYLPEGIETIGDESFVGTNLYRINIPSTVTRIGAESFRETHLQNIIFSPTSSLTNIGYAAFSNCSWLEEISMPNSVTTLERYGNSSDRSSETFYNCRRLKKIIFSDAITILPKLCCYENNSVEELHLPNNLVSVEDNFMYGANSVKELKLPASLRTIGASAFAGLHQVEILELPDKLQSIGSGAFHNSARLNTIILSSGVDMYNQTFRGCSNIKTIICHAATPPTIKSDPFSNTVKAEVTLQVPSFSVASYKLDPYWYKFGNIIEGSPIDYWKIISDLKLLNNRRMEGKPDIDLYYGGKLTIGGDAPMEVGKLDIYTSEGSPSSLVSDCNAFTADEINTIFKVDANKWYFITPMADIDLRQVNVSGTANYVFRYYDGAIRADIGAGTSWKNVSDMTLKAGVGYIFQCNAASDITFPVAVELRSKILSTNAFTLPLTAHPSDNAANKGWNYVGNPYPSYYDIYYMDFTAPITVWTGSTYRAYSIADDNYVLRPMQGFFVQKPDAVDVITLQVAGRQIESTVNRPSKVKSRVVTEEPRAIFNLEIGGEESADMTRVVLNENAELGYEIERDASKFMSMDDAVAQIYTIDDADNKLAINERPANDGIVNLGVYIPNSNDEYIISASRIDGNAILVDKENDIEHDLSNSGYKFTSMSEGLCEGRFALKLKSDITSGITGICADDVLVETVADGIIVKGAENVIVYNTEGIQLYSNTSVNGEVHIELAKGIYVAVANGKSYKVAVK